MVEITILEQQTFLNCVHDNFLTTCLGSREYLIIALKKKKILQESTTLGHATVWVDPKRQKRDLSILHCKGLSSVYADKSHHGVFLTL